LKKIIEFISSKIPTPFLFKFTIEERLHNYIHSRTEELNLFNDIREVLNEISNEDVDKFRVS